MANPVLYGLVVAILSCHCSICLTHHNADASSENGLIFYSAGEWLQAEADQKYNLQRVEKTDANEKELKPITDTADENQRREEHE
ncbi:MAG: hypothetical protein ACLP29_03105 [Dissulfurispiraceae bacterium]|jgi:hypothetical protein